jgi:subtilisin family serine protease
MAKTGKRKSPGASHRGGVEFGGLNRGEVAASILPDYVIVRLKDSSPVALAGALGFSAPAPMAAQAQELNQALAAFDVELRPHFGRAMSARARTKLAVSIPALGPQGDRGDRNLDEGFVESAFVQVRPKKGHDAQAIVSTLKRHDAVLNAYVAPRPVPAVLSGSQAGSRNFEPSQGYLHSAPNGIGAMEIWPEKGGTGEGITICDVEGNWNLDHEDLPRGINQIGGTVINDPEWRNHGTAVLGEMVSQSNDFGTVGICHDAKVVVQSAVIDGVFNTAGAIINAAGKLKAGDVILIELQALGGPNNQYLAMQFWEDVFTAIQVATEKGITVVEAGGNGNQNFDLAAFKNTGLQKDSGAIVVGAGVPPTNFVDHEGAQAYGGPAPYGSLGPPRSRLFFSNYGQILSLQGWGMNVTTLAYGDAQGDKSENKWYTLRFNGTSSASPIVTGAVACLQGLSKAKKGSVLTPDQVRRILIKTGTPQEAGPGVPLSQKIGPLPDLARAIRQL